MDKAPGPPFSSLGGVLQGGTKARRSSILLPLHPPAHAFLPFIMHLIGSGQDGWSQALEGGSACPPPTHRPGSSEALDPGCQGCQEEGSHRRAEGCAPAPCLEPLCSVSWGLWCPGLGLLGCWALSPILILSTFCSPMPPWLAGSPSPAPGAGVGAERPPTELPLWPEGQRHGHTAPPNGPLFFLSSVNDFFSPCTICHHPFPHRPSCLVPPGKSATQSPGSWGSGTSQQS